MINNVVLVGRITRDIEMNMSNSGTEVCRFTLAVNRNRKNASGGYDADFINCVAFGQSARFMSQYLRKGYQVAVTGRIQTGSYDNQQGQRVYTTDVIVENISNLEPRRDNSGFGQNDFGAPNNFGQQNTFQQQPDTYSQPTTDNVTTISPNPFDNSNNGSSVITDDDLPF